MTEGISDQGIIERLREIESSLWETLLENRPFGLDNVSRLIQNPAYMAAHQRVKNSDQFDHQPSSEDEQITSLYHRINQMVDAIPVIRFMQFSDDLEESKWHFDHVLTPKTQESVQSVLEGARLKLDTVRTEYASFGEASGDQAGPTDAERRLNRELGLQLRELLTLLPAASLPTEAKKSPLEIVRLIPGNPRATTPEEPSRRSEGVLEGMRGAAAQAASAFGGAVQNLINRFMGPNHTQ